MKPIRRILVPVDFSQHADAAVEWAIRFGRQLDAEIELLHCIEGSPLAAVYGRRFPESYGLALERAARDALAEVARRVASRGLRVREHVVSGRAAAQVAVQAAALDADLVVMGTRGQSGLSHVLLGSVAARTIQRAPCPVLAVRGEDPG